jgi:endonuclease/exonuclease/phosphatase family metal-dependent hydrolase
MKKFFAIFFLTLTAVFFTLIGFYFWASSPNLPEIRYNEVKASEVPVKIPNDSVHSIITYNLGYLSGMTNNLPVEKPRSLFEENMNKVIRALKQTDADIISFQEIDFNANRSFYINQHEEIAKLGYPFSGLAINWDKKYVPFPYFPFSVHFGKVISGQSVLSKYKILEQKRIALDRNPNNPFYYDTFYLDRLAQVLKIEVRNQILVLINVHLEAYNPSTRAKQMRQIKKLYMQYYKEFPTILLGDFNSDVRFPDASIKLLLNLPKTGCVAFDPINSQNTFSSKVPEVRLDYIFYNEQFIKEISGKVLDQFQEASDHLPLLMKFKFKNQTLWN